MPSTSTCRPSRPHVEPLVPRPAGGELTALARAPWTLRVGRVPLMVRPSSARDLAAVARMHSRCSPRSLLDRYRFGGRPPAIATLDAQLRRPDSIVAVTPDGDVVATATLARDRGHSHFCAEVGVLVEDRWQRLGMVTELMTHMAGLAQAAGFHELIAYPATAVAAVQRLMLDVGRTRVVPDVELHLHTYLPESATLGLGSVRQRLAG
jgi:L-amino acid N-acyltransferase YncA